MCMFEWLEWPGKKGVCVLCEIPQKIKNNPNSYQGYHLKMNEVFIVRDMSLNACNYGFSK